MRSGFLRLQAQEEVNNQLGSNDEGLVISFNNTPRIDQRWTRSKSALVNSIDYNADGGTDLYGSVVSAVGEAAPRTGRSAVIALTDGNDRGATTLTDAISEAQQQNVPVYTIGLGSDADENALKTLAADTGGDYYKAPSASDLSTIYQQISQQINNEYRITYTTTNTATDGTTRLVRTTASNGTDQGSDTGQYVAPCAPLPTADFTASVSGQTVTFDAGPSSANGGSIAAYSWDFINDGQIDATGQTASHSYSSAGSYEVRLTVEKTCGASDSATQTVTVDPPSDDGTYTYRVPHTLNTQQLSSAWNSRVAVRALNESASVDIDTDGDGTPEQSTAVAPGNATSVSTPPAGTVITTSAPVSVDYRYGSGDFGAYEDGRYQYGVPEESALGTEYYIPVGGTSLAIAATEATTVDIDTTGDGQFDVTRSLGANETTEVANVSAGARVVASEAVHVVVQSARWSNKDGTYATSVLPVSEAKTEYDLRGHPNYNTENPTDQSAVYVAGTQDGTTVTVGTQTKTVNESETAVILTSVNVTMTATEPVVALQSVYIVSDDWWSSARRHNIGLATPVESMEISAGTWDNKHFDGGLTVWSDYSGLNVSSQPAAANFEVRNLSAPASVTQGDTVTVTAVVENTGGVQETQNVELVVGGSSTAIQQLTLSAGQSQQVSFSLSTGGLTVGTRTVEVRTDDDSRSTQLDILGTSGGKTVKLVPTNTNVPLGTTQTFDIVLEDATEGSQGYDLTVEVSDASVAEIVDAETAGTPGLQDTVSVSSDNSSVSITAGYLNALNGSQSLTLGTVTVEGTATGSTDISVDSSGEIRNGTNIKYALGSFESTTVSVSQSITMPGRQQPAQDMDGDGLLEDLDGDGQANVFDAIELANNANAPVVQNNLQLFDHDGDGKVDVFDAVELANEVRN